MQSRSGLRQLLEWRRRLEELRDGWQGHQSATPSNGSSSLRLSLNRLHGSHGENVVQAEVDRMI